VGESKVPN